MENFTLMNFRKKASYSLFSVLALALMGMSSSFNEIPSFEDSPLLSKTSETVSGNESKTTEDVFLIDLEGCSVSEQKELRTSDFGFPDGIQDGSLSAENVDLSSKWGLPEGSIIVSVSGASSKSSLQLFEVNKDLPATFTFSGSVPVLVVAEHSPRVDAGQRDGIRSMDGVEYLHTGELPDGIMAGNEGTDNYYVENITSQAINGPKRFVWESQDFVSEVEFYTTSTFPINGIRIRLTPVVCPDTDGDGVPDSADLDDDNDGILDTVEDPNIDQDNDPLTDPYDLDEDGYPNHLDIDSDNDGIPDNVEAQTTEGYIAPNDDNFDTYQNNDGVNSAYPDGITPVNTDGQDIEDYIDGDSDNDRVPDNNEGNDFNFDGVPDQTFTGNDVDRDGLDDGYEGADANDGFDVNDEIDDPANDLPDTDGTEDVNYRDIDDDGDSIDTYDEDVDENNDPTNDDSDSNGTPDYLDPNNENLDTDEDGVIDTADLDDDNDGILDTLEDSNVDGDDEPSTNPTDTDGDGYPDYLDIDSDNDGLPDNIEAQTTDGYIPPNDDNEEDYKANDGLNSAYPDGIDPVNTDDDDILDYVDPDSDNDTVPDNVEGNDFNFDGEPDQTFTGVDTDGDGLDDGYENGSIDDGFNFNDAIDNPANYLPDSDGTEDVDYRDATNNPDTDIDTDGDGVQDTVDLDDDNDGILDSVEDPDLDGDENPLTDPLDSDNDGIPNHLDIDSDDDGLPDNVEAQLTDEYTGPNDDDDSTYEANNGLNTAYPEGIIPVNTDGDDDPDYLDLDSDNDLVFDNNEGNDFNFDGEPDQEFTGVDTDGDGLDDGYEHGSIDEGYNFNDGIDDPANDLPDTDGSEDVNYRDFDDDGDNIDTPDEDCNQNGDPTDDDVDDDGIPSYLDPDELKTTEIIVMQMVTPNGDGKNEFLWIENVNLALNNTLQIFNRWGLPVYKGENYNNQNNVFDGRSRGRNTINAQEYLPAGVYFYIFEYSTVDGKEVTDAGYFYISK